MEHGIVCRLAGDPMGYFGWPSIARTDDGTLIVASSGLRAHHICPWGKTVLHVSGDQGRTWSDAAVVNDSPIDDRDAGIISLGGSRLLLSWFTIDTRKFLHHRDNWLQKTLGAGLYEKVVQETAQWRDETVSAHLGSWIRTSDDGCHWQEAVRAPVSAPHGPIRLADRSLLYLGKEADAQAPDYLGNGRILAAASNDGGDSWAIIGVVPIPDDAVYDNFHEPHVVELPSGKLIGMIRYEHRGPSAAYTPFSLFQTESADGGRTWSAARPTGVAGSPPHLIRHSSGALVCVYGYRLTPYGERAMISYDQGATWMADYCLRDDAPDGDLGYPASVELADGSIFTIYYQKCATGENPSLLWTRWNQPVRPTSESGL